MKAYWILWKKKMRFGKYAAWHTFIENNAKFGTNCLQRHFNLCAPRLVCVHDTQTHTDHKYSADFCSIREFLLNVLVSIPRQHFKAIQTNLLCYGLRCVFVMISRDNDTVAVSCCCFFHRFAQHRRIGIRYPVERDNRQKQSHSQPFTYDSIHDACTS